jgi:nondiscriminating glutamyl-tRNA synthetase
MTRTRFAPSPTGRLHLGNARTALFSALLAAHEGGRFMLRAEDTDAARSKEEHFEGLLEDLRWLGLRWDEGPDVGGPHGPYRQRERAGIYADYCERLERSGQAYPCFCTAEELAAERAAALRAGRAPRYSGRCAGLTRDQAARRLADGESASLRFRVPAGRALAYTDIVRGEQQASTDTLGDFVIRRSDGTTPFFFANALDDALMQVTHVLRGEDHLANTPRQLLLLEALELEAPRYGHLPLVVDEAGKPLSKRNASVGLAELRAQGWLPLAIANYLFRLGHASERGELLDWPDMAREFDTGHLGRASAHYDEAQLAHWQHLAIAGLDAEAAAAWSGVDFAPREAFWTLVRENVSRQADVSGWQAALGPEPPLDAAATATLASADQELWRVVAELSDEDDFSLVTSVLRERTGLGGRRLFKPLRAALTGRHDGPELARLWAWFSPAERLARIERAAAMER